MTKDEFIKIYGTGDFGQAVPSDKSAYGPLLAQWAKQNIKPWMYPGGLAAAAGQALADYIYPEDKEFLSLVDPNQAYMGIPSTERGDILRYNQQGGHIEPPVNIVNYGRRLRGTSRPYAAPVESDFIGEGWDY